MISPLVSIKCTVYNHEPYLRQCLDGFVMQKTNFPFEAIVHDDASTDGSAAIIREYAEKYPDIIKPIYETENQYSKKDGSLGRIMNAAIHPDVKYIALCEGDDYWIDPNKLQKQFDFMESHQDYSLCCHETKQYRQNTGEFSYNPIKGLSEGFSFDLSYYVTGVWIIQTLTLFYRKSAYDYNIYRQYKSPMDATLFYHLLKSGKGFLMPEIMSVYRIHSGGAYSGRKYNVFFRWYMKTIEGIHIVENTKFSRLYLYNTFKNNLYKIILFRDASTYMKSIKLVKQYLGFNAMIKVICFSLYKLSTYLGKIILSKVATKTKLI